MIPCVYSLQLITEDIIMWYVTKNISDTTQLSPCDTFSCFWSYQLPHFDITCCLVIMATWNLHVFDMFNLLQKSKLISCCNSKMAFDQYGIWRK